MNKEWIQDKLNNEKDKVDKAKKYIISIIDNYLDLINNSSIEEIKENNLDAIKKTLNKNKKEILQCNEKTSYYCTFDIVYLFCQGIPLFSNKTTENERIKVMKNVNIINNIKKCNKKWFEYMYLDSEPVRFDGDIVITDPCYAFTASSFKNGLYMERDTIYGDWSCDTINTDTKEKIGNFCADSGRVCVAYLSDILKNKKDFLVDCKEHCRTIIKDFHGTVQFVISENKGSYRNDKNEEKKYVDYIVTLKGEGNINFMTIQTGF